MSELRRAGKALRKAWLLRKTPLKRSTKPLRRTSLRRVSKKRRKQMHAYSLLRSAFLEAHPVCQVCDMARSVDVHHKAKRGKNYLNVDTWLAVCRQHHEAIHANPHWARSFGYLV